MDQVAHKTYLGLALEQTIQEMGLSNKADKIFGVFEETFNEQYKAFCKSHSENFKIDGKLTEHYEYPVGENEKLQYYQAYGTMGFQIHTSRTRLDYLCKNSPSLLEGFSTNEGPKTLKNKNRRAKFKEPAPRKRRH